MACTCSTCTTVRKTDPEVAKKPDVSLSSAHPVYAEATGAVDSDERIDRNNRKHIENAQRILEKFEIIGKVRISCCIRIIHGKTTQQAGKRAGHKYDYRQSRHAHLTEKCISVSRLASRPHLRSAAAAAIPSRIRSAKHGVHG